MTTEQYITSGILEVYACGGLSPQEMAEVEKLVQENPVIKTEIQRIEAALENYAQLHASVPPPRLKSEIMKQIATEAHSETVWKTPEKVALLGVQKHFFWFAAAAVFLLMISAAGNYFFYTNWKKAEKNLNLALTDKAAVAGKFKQANFYLKQTEIALHILENTETKHIVMQGLPQSPSSTAMIHWDPESKMVLLEVKKLPVAPAGKQYQLWALKNGKPIDAGLFNPTDTLMGIQQMKIIPEADSFVMTLEPIGGSNNPTKDAMYLLGSL